VLLGLHRGQRRRRFGGGDFVGCCIAAGQQQGIHVGRRLEYVDPHVVDHLNDVFDLIRIGDVLGQVVVDLGVGQIALVAALADQFTNPGLLLEVFAHCSLLRWRARHKSRAL
jgi:hypothetical protein